MSVLWYVHHQGAGHWRRALAVCHRLVASSPSVRVVLASSSAPAVQLPPRCSHVLLPPDAPASSGADTTAHGRLHWAPVAHRGLLDRHRVLLGLVAEHRPALAVVDVSVEVAALLRLSGVPVLSVRLPGTREDAAHELGFGLSDEVVLPVPAAWGLHGGLARTRSVGLVSALRPRPVAADADEVCLVVGRGGSTVDLGLAVDLARGLPERTVRVLGELADPVGAPAAVATPPNLVLTGPVTDVAARLARAAVVVGASGMGTVADVAAAARPLVVRPESRPFGEQHATAEALRRTGGAAVVHGRPGPQEWRDAVLSAVDGDLRPPAPDGDVTFAALVAELAGPDLAGTDLADDAVAVDDVPVAGTVAA